MINKNKTGVQEDYLVEKLIIFQFIDLTDQLEFRSYLLFVQLIFIVIIRLKLSLLSLYVLRFGLFLFTEVPRYIMMA